MVMSPSLKSCHWPQPKQWLLRMASGLPLMLHLLTAVIRLMNQTLIDAQNADPKG